MLKNERMTEGSTEQIKGKIVIK